MLSADVKASIKQNPLSVTQVICQQSLKHERKLSKESKISKMAMQTHNVSVTN